MWHVGPIPLRAYALCIIAGIVLAVWLTDRRFVARGGAPGFVIDVAVWAVPFGLVGGRLYHLATDWRTYFGPGGDPVAALYVWNGGLGIWGAIALGGVGAWIACRRRGVPLTAFADAAAPGIVLAQAVGRLGNWFNQELYGAPTTLPWGLEIYRRVDPATGAPDNLGGVALDRTPVEIVQPTFLYELVWNILVAILVVVLDRRLRLSRGRAFAALRRGLHRRALRHRAAAHRPGDPGLRRRADQRRRRGRRVRRGGGLPARRPRPPGGPVRPRCPARNPVRRSGTSGTSA